MAKQIVELTDEEIRFCMRGIHELWSNYGISNKEIKFLIKLEKYIGMTETKDYFQALGLGTPWLEGEEDGEEESWT